MNNIYHLIKTPVLVAGIIFLSAFYSHSQTTVDVTVSSNQFSPSDVTINVGDAVRWTNVGGFHNVNGTQVAYPDNPESFGRSEVGSGWVYTFTFNTPGFYNYHCDPHQFQGMTGTVTVNETTGIFDREMEGIKTLYPNPTKDVLHFELEDSRSGEIKIEVYTVEGKLVKSETTIQKELNSFTVDEIQNGYYLLHIQAGEQVYQASFIKQ